MKTRILETGLRFWRSNPSQVTTARIAKELGITRQAVDHYFAPKDLQNAVADYAVVSGDSVVIAQLIITKHAAVDKLSEEERNKHLSFLFR